MQSPFFVLYDVLPQQNILYNPLLIFEKV